MAKPLVLLIFGFLATPTLAQQTELPARAQQQPFGQPPPPLPAPPPPQRPQDNDARPRAPIRQMYRGLLAIDDTSGNAGEEIDAPVTGYGNDLFWDPPAALHARVASR